MYIYKIRILALPPLYEASNSCNFIDDMTYGAMLVSKFNNILTTCDISFWCTNFQEGYIFWGTNFLQGYKFP